MTMTTTRLNQLSETIDDLEVAVRLGAEDAKSAIDAEITAHVTDDAFRLSPGLTEELLRLYLTIRSDVVFPTYVELLGGDNGGLGYYHDGSSNAYFVESNAYRTRPGNKPVRITFRRDNS